MVYILIYSIENKKETVVIDNDKDLVDMIGKLEGIGKQKTITLYQAEQISYKFTMEDKTETVITKIPKVEILK